MNCIEARRHEGTTARSRKPHLGLRRCGSGSPQRPAFSLIEVLLAIFILGIGVIGIAALFPAGMAQQQRSIDDIMGPIVANNALATLRSKLGQDDFGSYEDFPGAFSYAPEFEYAGTVRGDWLWRPPAVLFEDDPSTRYVDERGAIDVFTHNSGLPHSSASPHIPFNPRKFDETGAGKPLVLFTRGERMYPNSEYVRNFGIEEPAQYYWDCLFRRFQGRILVAVFVYRVTVPSSEDYIYTVPPNPVDASIPYVPYQFNFGYDLTSDAPPWPDMLDATGFIDGYTPTEVPDTDPDANGTWAWSTLDPADPNQHWQYTGQWLLDQNNNVHRVLAGREKDASRPMELVDRIPVMPKPNAYSGRSVYFYDRAPASGDVGVENIITNLWYIPRRVRVNLDATGYTPASQADDWITLTPVYLVVEEL